MKKSNCEPHAPLRFQYVECGARAKQNVHQPCRNPAMKNGRCRLHGGRSTGPKTPVGKLNSAKANYKHGYYSHEEKFRRALIRDILKSTQEL